MHLPKVPRHVGDDSVVHELPTDDGFDGVAEHAVARDTRQNIIDTIPRQDQISLQTAADFVVFNFTAAPDVLPAAVTSCKEAFFGAHELEPVDDI